MVLSTYRDFYDCEFVYISLYSLSGCTLTLQAGFKDEVPRKQRKVQEEKSVEVDVYTSQPYVPVKQDFHFVHKNI